jgi:hypothetical protein
VKISDIALKMEESMTTETLVNTYQTTQLNIPEDGNLHTNRCENFKYRPEDGGSNTSETLEKHLPDYTAHHIRRQESSYSPLRKLQISP